MKILTVTMGVLITIAFLILGVLKGLWLNHMKMEEFNIFWQDYVTVLIWLLLAVVTAGGTIWFVI